MIEVGTHYLYQADRSKHYTVIAIGKMKVGDEWLDSVTYQDENGNTYTRAKGEFAWKFEEVKG